MSDFLVVESIEKEIIEISDEEIVVIENSFSVLEINNGGIASWGTIIGNLANQIDLKNALDLKVDKATGKGLSTEDYTTAEKTKLSGISGTNTGDETQTSINTKIGYTPANDGGVVHNTGNETIAGNKTFSNEVTLNSFLNFSGQPMKTATYSTVDLFQADGKYRFRTGNTGIMFGRGTESAVVRVQQHENTAIANVHKITNSTTGLTLTDGFDIGITGTGIAQIKQLENLNLEFYTNNVKTGDISNAGVWANNSGTWSTLSDVRLKENINPVTDALEKCLLLAKCVRHYTFKNQTKYATGKRTGYIAQLLKENGFEGHITYNKPVDEEEGILLGWEYDNESYFEDETKFRTVLDEEYNEIEESYVEPVEKTRRIVAKEGEMILGIENNFVPYVFGAIEQLNNRLKALEDKLGV